MSEQGEIFRVVEERQVSLPRYVEGPHILDFRLKIDLPGRGCSRSLGHGAQGKGASTLKKAWMFHRIFTEGTPVSANDAKRSAETRP
jgi:hypothetical protein